MCMSAEKNKARATENIAWNESCGPRLAWAVLEPSSRMATLFVHNKSSIQSRLRHLERPLAKQRHYRKRGSWNKSSVTLHPADKLACKKYTGLQTILGKKHTTVSMLNS